MQQQILSRTGEQAGGGSEGTLLARQGLESRIVRAVPPMSNERTNETIRLNFTAFMNWIVTE